MAITLSTVHRGLLLLLSRAVGIRVVVGVLLVVVVVVIVVVVLFEVAIDEVVEVYPDYHKIHDQIFVRV